MKKSLAAICTLLLFWGCAPADQGWIELFDGQSLKNWRAAENPSSFSVVDGAIKCHGPRGHLFYIGPDSNASFRNFEFSAEVMARAGANSGIFFHTKYKDHGWPSAGMEAQVNNSQKPGGTWYEFKKTGSIYGVRNVFKQLIADDTWFTMRIRVQGNHVAIHVNDLLVSEYSEPASPARTNWLLGEDGTFALQAHDPGSEVYYRNLRVRPLPDTNPEQADPESAFDARITALQGANYPLIDYHIHLKGGLERDQALANSRKYGINYGVAVNCGIGFPVTNDEELHAFVDNYDAPHTFLAMQAEGREWVNNFSAEARKRFDYVFTDALTWTDDNGKRIRLWVKEDIKIDDAQKFMDMYVDRAVGILENEPIDLFVNPTFLPEVIRDQYEALWTPARMDRIISAAAAKNIAIEINARYQIPGAAFITRAKAAGIKFAMGTNNKDGNYGHLEYAIAMIDSCKLSPFDLWMPARYAPNFAQAASTH